MRHNNSSRQAMNIDRPARATVILDNATIKYASPCYYCKRKQKVLSLAPLEGNWSFHPTNICTGCLLTALTYLQNVKRA